MNWKRKVYYALSPKFRRTLRRIYYFPIDTWEGITGKRDTITPPKGKIFIGPGNFTEIGNKLKNDCIQYGGLKSSDRVLDIGCGIGRLAIPLTKYIDNNGSYNGFDIVEDGILWCNKKISSQFPNFHFDYLPLRNDLYNLETGAKAENFTFPYPNQSFDFTILTSVFTHMQDKEVAQYLKEISRVLDQNGTCFATFFIINKHSQQFLNTSKDPFFKFDYGHFMLHDEKVKDANIAFKIDYLESILNDAGLKIEHHHTGWWCGGDKTKCIDFQDVLIIKHC